MENPKEQKHKAKIVSPFTSGYMKQRILNVGSGPVGEYGVQLDKPAVNFDIMKQASNLTMQGDAHCLPFRDHVFTSVYASHVLEHLPNPGLALEEFHRVAPLLIVKVPNATWHRVTKDNVSHLYTWTAESLESLLRTVYKHVKLYYSYRWRLTQHGSKSSLPKRVITRLLIQLCRSDELTAVAY